MYARVYAGCGTVFEWIMRLWPVSGVLPCPDETYDGLVDTSLPNAAADEFRGYLDSGDCWKWTAGVAAAASAAPRVWAKDGAVWLPDGIRHCMDGALDCEFIFFYAAKRTNEFLCAA